MSREKYLDEIRKNLKGLNKDDIDKSVEYYSELISDYIEDGLSVEEAIERIGSPENVAKEIKSGIPTLEVKPKRKLKTWQKVTLIVTSPIWLAILVALAVVALSLVIVVIALVITMWATVASLWCAVASLAVGGLAGVYATVAFALSGALPTSLLMCGFWLVLFGLTVVTFLGMKQLTKWCTKLTAWLIGFRFKAKEAKEK